MGEAHDAVALEVYRVEADVEARLVRVRVRARGRGRVGLGVGLGRGLDVEARRDGGRQRGAPGDPGRACVIRVAAARARLLLQHLRELVPADEAGLVRVRVRVRVRARASELVPADEAGLGLGLGLGACG